MDKENTNTDNEKASKKTPTIPGTKKEAEFFVDSPETRHNTIMPTMLDDSEEVVEKKQDLSAIIPSFEDNSVGENATELISQDNLYKSDASITLAFVNDQGDVTISPNAALPEQIDMEQRKKEFAESKNVRKAKKKEKKDRKKARRNQKQQNIISLISLIIIIALGSFGYYLFTRKTEDDFVVKRVVVELGEALPAHKSSYITPGVGSDLDEIKYVLDLTNVVLEHTGEYPYTVTYTNSKGAKIKKNGTIVIEDKLPPELEVKNVIISEGQSYNASSFVAECRDPSGCNYSFQDEETPLKYTTSGTYTVYIVATDAFGNKETKKANLTIEVQGNIRRYAKNTEYNQNLGYELSETYDLRFQDNGYDGILISGTYEKIFKYQDIEKYEAARKEFAGEYGFTSSDSDMSIIYKSSANVVGNNYTYLSDIDNYLNREGFRRER